MSEKNSLKLLYQTAKTTADLDLFLYTGINIVGRDGLVQIVADVIFDRLVQTCEGQDELEYEMMHPSILARKIWYMKFEFAYYLSHTLWSGSDNKKVEHKGVIYGSYFYTQAWQFRRDLPDGGYIFAGAFVRRLCSFDDVDFTKFQIYRFGGIDDNTFILPYGESVELLQYVIDFISSN